MAAEPDAARGGDLVRHLASVYASYRLFPGDPTQPAFQAAVERLAGSARRTLASGPFVADVRSARFVTPAGEVRSDETTERLGLALFDRRVEQLHVHAVPSADELVGFCEMLSLPIDEVADRGGAGTVLKVTGVTSITVGELGDDEEEDEDDEELASLTPDQLLLWERLQDPGTLAAALMIEGMPREPAAAAHDLYVRFRAIEEILPGRLTARRDFFLRIRQVFDHLPTAVSREFHAIVLTRLSSERFAMSFGVNLTDQELVEVLFDLAEYGGPDPADLGQRIVALTDRKGAVLELIESRREAAGVDLSDLAATEDATLVALNLAAGDDQVRTAVADALAEQLVDVSNEDAAAIRELFPDSEEDRRTLSLLSLRDYLAAEDRRVSIERVLSVWTSAVRSALATGEEPLVQRLLDLLAGAIAPGADVFKRDAAEAARRGVPTPQLVRTLLADGAGGPGAEALAASLDRFGDRSLEAVLDVLAEEEETGRRARLLTLASALAPGRVDVIADRVHDDRWYVVRNLVTILGRTGSGEEALPTLARLVKHPDASVRREVVRSLVAATGAGAVPYLRRLADDPDEHVAGAARQAIAGVAADVAARALADLAQRSGSVEERRRTLELLAGHPSSEVPELLTRLASRSQEPALPAPLRRHARKLARGRAKGADA